MACAKGGRRSRERNVTGGIQRGHGMFSTWHQNPSPQRQPPHPYPCHAFEASHPEVDGPKIGAKGLVPLLKVGRKEENVWIIVYLSASVVV